MSNTVKIASIQLDVAYRNPKACLAKVLEWIDRASSEKADVAVFPELMLSGGYMLGNAFYDIAEPVPGPASNVLASKAKMAGIAVIAGIAERAANDVLYNSVVLIDKNGRIAGTYRKTHIFPECENIFAVGRDLPVFDLGFGNIASQVCYDFEFPEPARVLALKTAQIIFSPSAIMEQPLGSELVEPAENFIRTIYAARALENRIPTVLSNRVGFDPDLKTSYAGLSRIVNSEGVTLKEAGKGEEMITATIDLDETRIKRQKYNYFRDRKPYLYSEIVQERPSLP